MRSRHTLLFSFLLFTACKIEGLGATPGGAKDIAYAREIIEGGGVPDAEAITVEGLISEHDIPLEGPACDELLCIRPALGLAPSLETGRRETWLQLGMMSGIDGAVFERPPLDVVVALDKSGSMSIDMSETTEAIARMAAKMRPQDRLGIVAFDDRVHELRPLARVDDSEALGTEVRRIEAGGSFNIVEGVRHPYAMLERARDRSRMARVMVLSCGYPELDAKGGDAFSVAVTRGAEQGIGMSFFGVLLGYSAEVSDLLARTPGGASYYLQDLERVKLVFDDDFDVMVTPLAYDLEIGVAPGAGFRLSRFYGVPGDTQGAARSMLEVRTAFLSRRGGALVARLSQSDDSARAPAKVSLSYRPETALGFSATAQSEDASAPVDVWSSEAAYFQTSGVRRVVALTNQAERMRTACALHAAGDDAGAAVVLRELDAYLTAEATVDSSLENEAQLVKTLLSNVGG